LANLMPTPHSWTASRATRVPQIGAGFVRKGGLRTFLAVNCPRSRNALGRSRGGFSTKINARANAEGLPIGVVITPGQAHDVTAFPALMQEIDCNPGQMLGDKSLSGHFRPDYKVF
jgi:Transposase DDE domain